MTGPEWRVVTCAEPDCHAEQDIDRRNRDNLAGRWRCHDHYQAPIPSPPPQRA